MRLLSHSPKPTTTGSPPEFKASLRPFFLFFLFI